jgi:hypothetical protein
MVRCCLPPGEAPDQPVSGECQDAQDADRDPVADNFVGSVGVGGGAATGGAGRPWPGWCSPLGCPCRGGRRHAGSPPLLSGRGAELWGGAPRSSRLTDGKHQRCRRVLADGGAGGNEPLVPGPGTGTGFRPTVQSWYRRLMSARSRLSVDAAKALLTWGLVGPPGDRTRNPRIRGRSKRCAAESASDLLIR